MGLRNATKNAELLALDGEWVELNVGANDWSVRKATVAEADAYWEAHRPPPVSLPPYNTTVTGLVDLEDVTPEVTGTPLRTSIVTSIRAFGGKAAHYSILAKTDGLPVPKAFAIPIYYYDQFMKENGLFARLDALLADSSFVNDPQTRDEKLAEFRAAMMTAPVDASFQEALKAKIQKDYPGEPMRFRTSTNNEDLDGFPCAGCYESHTGNPANWNDVLDAIRETWASIWLFRTFEERTYYGVDHRSVGMALLVHHSFPDEEANGVAVTANPFDESGLEPGFYVNVQWGGDAEVVHPPPGVTSDQFLYFFDSPNQPITFISHSNLVPTGETVLTKAQTYELGKALAAIQDRFSPAYGPASGKAGFYAMDVEFKFDDEAPGEVAKLAVKQARPYPGRGKAE
jgi:phosphoenolpyruvate synthase/pyruvate phosphate dikinase